MKKVRGRKSTTRSKVEHLKKMPGQVRKYLTRLITEPGPVCLVYQILTWRFRYVRMVIRQRRECGQ